MEINFRGCLDREIKSHKKRVGLQYVVCAVLTAKKHIELIFVCPSPEAYDNGFQKPVFITFTAVEAF